MKRLIIRKQFKTNFERQNKKRNANANLNKTNVVTYDMAKIVAKI